MGLSSAGIGSNLDVASIVSQLMTAERQPVVQLDAKAASYQAKLSGYGTIKSMLAQFQTALGGLTDVAKFQPAKASIGDATIATATASAGAVPGSYSLEVTSLAQAQKLITAGQASSTAPIGSTGATLSLNFGTIDRSGATPTFTGNGAAVKSVTLNPADTSLTGIRNAINTAAIGVTASIVNDGTGTPYRLSLSVNDTGASNSLQISVGGDSAVVGLLSYDPTAANQPLTETVAAKNAAFKIDGIAITKASNTVTDAIDGVTVNLARTNAGTPTTVTVARDATSVIMSVNAFVKAYNDINKTLKDLSAYDPVTKKGGPLTGDASVRSIQAQVRGVLTAPVTGASGSYTLLSQIGVSLQKDGTLGVDATKLQAAANLSPADIAALFAGDGTGAPGTANAGKGYAFQLNQLTTGFLSTDGAIATRTGGLNESLKTIAKSKDTLNARLVRVEARYRAQFTSLDSIISKMSTTSTFLTQQLANLPRG